jgi:hypothetical protein
MLGRIDEVEVQEELRDPEPERQQMPSRPIRRSDFL